MTGSGRPADAAGAERGGGTPTWRRLVVPGLVLVALAITAVVLIGPIREEISEFVGEFGRWAPAAFVLVYVVLSLLLVPASVLALTAGILFGVALGAVLCLAGGVISAGAGFALGRHLGREPVARIAGDRLDQVDRWLGRHGLLAVAIARNLPALPYGLLNYAAGITGIPARRFVAGTLLGIIPGTLAYVTFGGSLDDVRSPRFILAAAGVVGLMVGSALLERRLNSSG